MLSININPIGTQYSYEDKLIELVELCYGFMIHDDEGYVQIFETEGVFRGGEIVNCFVHHESECIFMVCKCSGVYFEVYFDNYTRYELIEDELPFR